MSNTNLAMKFAAVGMAAIMTGCATRGENQLPRQQVVVDNNVVNTVAVLDPCTRENIKARPMIEVSRQELIQRTNAGEVNYTHAGYYLFAEKSITERFAPIAGAVIGGALGSTLGGKGGGRVAATVGGAALGAVGGSYLSRQEKLQRMSQESGCEAFLSANPAPYVVPLNSQQPYPRPRYNDNFQPRSVTPWMR